MMASAHSISNSMRGVSGLPSTNTSPRPSTTKQAHPHPQPQPQPQPSPSSPPTPSPITPHTTTRPLRPIHDILARLTWNTSPSHSFPSSHSPHATVSAVQPTPKAAKPQPIYIITYQDRHLGPLQTPLSTWQRDTTADDFIPLHRIRTVTLRFVDPSPGQEGVRNAGIETKDDVLAREGKEEAKRKICEMERRMKGASEEVRERLGEVVRGLRTTWGLDFEDGENKDGDDEEAGLGGGEGKGIGEENGVETRNVDIVLWDREKRIDRVFGSGVSEVADV